MRIPPPVRRFLIFLAVVALAWYFGGRPLSFSQWWQAGADFRNRYSRPAGYVSAVLLTGYLLYFSIAALTYKRKGYDYYGAGCLWMMVWLLAALAAMLALGFALNQKWLIGLTASFIIGPTIATLFGLIAEGYKVLRKKWDSP